MCQMSVNCLVNALLGFHSGNLLLRASRPILDLPLVAPRKHFSSEKGAKQKAILSLSHPSSLRDSIVLVAPAHCLSTFQRCLNQSAQVRKEKSFALLKKHLTTPNESSLSVQLVRCWLSFLEVVDEIARWPNSWKRLQLLVVKECGRKTKYFSPFGVYPKSVALGHGECVYAHLTRCDQLAQT